MRPSWRRGWCTVVSDTVPDARQDRVVVADHRDVVGDSHAQFLQFRENADGGEIVSCVDGGGRLEEIHELPGTGGAGLLVERPLDDDRSEAALDHRLDESVPAFGAARRDAGVDVANARVSQVDQVIDDEAAAMVFVVVDRVETLRVDVGADGNRRGLHTKSLEHLVGQAGSCEQQPIGPHVHERFDRLELARFSLPAGAHEDLQVALGRSGRGTLGHFGEERVVEIVEHHPDGVRLARCEIAGPGVRPVAELVGRGEDLLPAAVGDPWGIRITRDTSARDTPACAATSSMVGLLIGENDSFSIGSCIERSTSRRCFRDVSDVWPWRIVDFVASRA